MSEDAGAAAGTAEGAGTTTDPGTAGTPGTGDTAGAPAASAEEMLATAVAAGADSSEGAETDPAKALLAAQADARKWRDLSKKNEARARENSTAAARLQEFEDAQKTENQRAADRALAAEQRAEQAEARYHRTLAAATYGVPPSLIDSIAGATEDEINSAAETLAAEINQRVAEQVAAQVAAVAAANGGSATAAGAAVAARGRRPVESMRAGAAPASASEPLSGGGWLSDQYVALKQQ